MDEEKLFDYLTFAMYNQTVPSQEEYCGKLSVTEFELLNEYHEKNLALYKVTLHTGRTHQIRVHFSDAGFPLHGTNIIHLYIYLFFSKPLLS